MGPREKALRANRPWSFPPDGNGGQALPDAYDAFMIARLSDALEEALNGWEYAAGYKGEFLMKKHGDAEDIARLRKVLSDADE